MSHFNLFYLIVYLRGQPDSDKLLYMITSNFDFTRKLHATINWFIYYYYLAYKFIFQFYLPNTFFYKFCFTNLFTNLFTNCFIILVLWTRITMALLFTLQNNISHFTFACCRISGDPILDSFKSWYCFKFQFAFVCHII